MTLLTENLPSVWDWLLRSTLQACVLIVVIRILQLVLHQRLKPRWHYALWLLLVLRLAMPLAPESYASIFNLFSIGS
jgi:bla regulator protein BlaR1